MFGFVSERVLDYWVESNGLTYEEMPVVNLEKQHWVKKGATFLKRKILADGTVARKSDAAQVTGAVGGR